MRNNNIFNFKGSEMVAEKSKFETTQFEGYLIKEDILYLHYYKGEEIDVDAIRFGFEIHDKLEVDENIKRIIHCEDFVSITPEARELVQTDGRPAKAEAYVIRSLSQKILFTIYQKFRKRKHPLKAFRTLEEALEWLNDY
ncbi:MAG: hypothetical protein H6582_08215 [Crocinitomicaceae bacterium]|nr:hypothetical protein [Crocinitomicaceae bacterium]